MLSHSSPDTLDSLVQYTKIQEERIESLLESGFQSPEQYDPMITLWRNVWGKSELCFDATEKIKRDLDKVDDSLIDGVVPNEFNVMILPPGVRRCWGIRCQKIFIRPSEYEEAEKAALATSRQEYEGILITGQPGIGLFILCFVIAGSESFLSGKSTFLLRLLLRRLTLSLPTALQTHPNRVMLFHKGGVVEFKHLQSWPFYSDLGPMPTVDGPPDRLWALVDSNQELLNPAQILGQGRFFVVHAASPHHSLQKWVKDSLTLSFYMEPWSFSEVLQA